MMSRSLVWAPTLLAVVVGTTGFIGLVVVAAASVGAAEIAEMALLLFGVLVLGSIFAFRNVVHIMRRRRMGLPR